jgi:hypothetical protein
MASKKSKKNQATVEVAEDIEENIQVSQKVRDVAD